MSPGSAVEQVKTRLSKLKRSSTSTLNKLRRRKSVEARSSVGSPGDSSNQKGFFVGANRRSSVQSLGDTSFSRDNSSSVYSLEAHSSSSESVISHRLRVPTEAGEAETKSVGGGSYATTVSDSTFPHTPEHSFGNDSLSADADEDGKQASRVAVLEPAVDDASQVPTITVVSECTSEGMQESEHEPGPLIFASNMDVYVNVDGDAQSPVLSLLERPLETIYEVDSCMGSQTCMSTFPSTASRRYEDSTFGSPQNEDEEEMMRQGDLVTFGSSSSGPMHKSVSDVVEHLEAGREEGCMHDPMGAVGASYPLYAEPTTITPNLAISLPRLRHDSSHDAIMGLSCQYVHNVGQDATTSLANTESHPVPNVDHSTHKAPPASADGFPSKPTPSTNVPMQPILTTTTVGEVQANPSEPRIGDGIRECTLPVTDKLGLFAQGARYSTSSPFPTITVQDLSEHAVANGIPTMLQDPPTSEVKVFIDKYQAEVDTLLHEELSYSRSMSEFSGIEYFSASEGQSSTGLGTMLEAKVHTPEVDSGPPGVDHDLDWLAHNDPPSSLFTCHSGTFCTSTPASRSGLLPHDSEGYSEYFSFDSERGFGSAGVPVSALTNNKLNVSRSDNLELSPAITHAVAGEDLAQEPDILNTSRTAAPPESNPRTDDRMTFTSNSHRSLSSSITAYLSDCVKFMYAVARRSMARTVPMSYLAALPPVLRLHRVNRFSFLAPTPFTTPSLVDSISSTRSADDVD